MLDYNETVVAAEFLCDHLGEEDVLLSPYAYQRLEALCAALGIADRLRGIPKPASP
ncbi:MAG TPA: MafI family immunity protein [Myxococcus sp.]|nr:MafI family immunity protein [Myxococcus sp.]